ncbi:MAG: DUF2232 domain-containing protein [Dialister sp.]|nr:DUF2232 domain-containing protein [Dialister sp.]
MNNTVRRAKLMTETAVAAALSAMLVLLKLVFPLLVVVTMWCSAVPIAIISSFYGMRWGLFCCAAEIALVNMLGGPQIGLTTAFYAAALGLAMGYGFLKNLSYWKTFALVFIAYVTEMSYKIIFSIYVLGIADALSASVERLEKILTWIWTPFANFFHADPNALSKSGLMVTILIFLLDACVYAYLNLEIGITVRKRLKDAARF